MVKKLIGLFLVFLSLGAYNGEDLIWAIVLFLFGLGLFFCKKKEATRGPSGSFFSKVAGVTFEDDDGKNRQKILKQCRVVEEIKLKLKPKPEHKNAVAVLRKNGEQIGYLPWETAEGLAPDIRSLKTK